MTEAQELTDLLKVIADLKSTKDKKEGQLEAAKETLKNKYNIDTLSDLEVELDKLKTSIEENKKKKDKIQSLIMEKINAITNEL